MRSYLVFVFWLIFSVASSNSEPTGKIQGRVVDAKTQEPLNGANVLVIGTVKGGVSDLEGNFLIEDLAPGTYQLRFSYVGYETVTKTDVVVATARPAIVNVEMIESFIQQKEIVVTPGYFVEEFQSPVSSTSLTAEEIRRFPGGFEDVVRTAATLPGVAVVNEGGRNDLLVRGGGPSENLYLVNNIEVPNINHFGTQGTSSGALSFVNLDFIDRVEFSTGGFGARYGDKMSSVLALDIRSGRTDHLGGKATISATQYGLNLEGPFAGKGDFLFSARHSYLDLIFKAAGQPFVPVYTDFNLFANYDLSPRSKLSVIGLAAIDRVNRDQSTLEKRVTNAGILDNTQNQVIAGVNWRRLASKGFFDFTLNTNYNGFRFSQIDEFEREYFNSKADEIELNLKLTSYFSIRRSGGIYAGVAAKNVFNDNTTVFADTIYDRSGRRVPVSSLGLPQVNIVNTSAQKYAAYAEWEQKLSDQFNLNFGLRGDYYGFLRDEFYPSARLAIGFKPTENLKFKTSFGRYYQSPSYVWVVNPDNKNLQALRNDMTIFGLEFLVRNDFNSSFEFYYKRYRDLPTGTITNQTDYLVLTNTGVGYGGREDDFQSFGYFPLASRGKGRAYGFEFLLQKRFSDIPCYGQFSIGYNKSEYTAGNGKIYPGQFDQRLILNLSGGYIFNSKWEVSSKFRYFTGAPFTPVYLPAQNGGVIQNLPEEYLSQRLQAGHHLDVRIDRRFNFASWTMILFLDIQNVYNFKAQRRPNYDFWENKIEDRNSIGLLPSIGISGEF
jgi:CarboxypepD_reg-like domain/TonB dependent receptor-like, beta-barrel/TonB-dependent Receptor Plug Domain